MSELVRLSSARKHGLVSSGTGPSTQGALLFDGRTRLRGVLMVDMSTGSNVGSCGLSTFVEFRNGDDEGDVLLKLWPNITPVSDNGGANSLNSQALSFMIPGNGILFDTGLYCQIEFQSGLAASGNKALGVTAFFG